MKLKDTNSGKEFDPTKSEMQVLRLLWQYGPSTVRFIHEKLNEGEKDVVYTSTLKLMQLMKDKGMLERDERQMKHIYIPLEEAKVQRGLLSRFVDKIFNGSASDLMLALLGDKTTSAEELQKMKEMLSQMDKKSK
jgi:predicted transcriptional regulator